MKTRKRIALTFTAGFIAFSAIFGGVVVTDSGVSHDVPAVHADSDWWN